MVLAALPWLIDLPDITLQELKGLVLGERVGNRIMYSEIIDRSPPLLAVMDGFLNLLFGRSLLARHILSLFILFFQAAFFAVLLIQNRAYNENTYVPSLLFGFLCFFSFDVLAFTPELIASSFLLLALNNVFKEIEFRVERDSIVLNLGVFLGLASLVVVSYSIFLVGVIFILAVFARATVRKIFLLLFGFCLTHGIVFTLYFFYDKTGDLWQHFYLANFNQTQVVLVSFHSMLILGAIPLSYFVISLLMLTREARFTRYQSQIFQILLLWMTVAALQLALAPEIAPHSFMTFIPPLTYFICHYLLLIRRKRIAELMMWILLAGVLTTSNLAWHMAISRIDYSGLFPKASPYDAVISNKRIMIIGDDMALYKRNSLGGIFLDWELSRRFLEEPDTYENVIRVNDAFADDPPDVIVDERGLLSPFFRRIPHLRKTYRKEGVIYWRL